MRNALAWPLALHLLVCAALAADPAPAMAQATDELDQTADMDETDAMEGAGDDRLVEMEERLGYLEEAMDEVEKRAVLDRLQLGADYRLIFNSLRYEGPSPDPRDRDPANPALPATVSRSSAEVWSHRLRIPVRGDITNNLRLTARLSMFKHFGDSDQPPFLQDFQGTRIPRDTGIAVEQAWLDWFIRDWLALSVGRLSYGGINPPGELKENTGVRIPTWSLQAVNGEFEALTLVFDLSRIVVPDLYVRAFYASWFQDFDDGTGDFGFLDSGDPNARIFGWSADLRVPGMDKVLGDTFVQIGQFMIPRFPALAVPIPDPAFDPQTNVSHAPPPFDGSLLFPSARPDSMGSYDGFHLLLQVQNARNLGLDAFLGTTLQFLSPNGQAISYLLPDPADPTMRQSTPFLYMASQGDSGFGALFLSGLRYTLPFGHKNDKAKLGLEYNYGSRYAINFAVPGDQLVNKWAVRGHAFETYLIYPLHEHLFLRGGVLHIDNNYRTGFYGPDPALAGSTAPPYEQSITNFNVILHAKL